MLYKISLLILAAASALACARPNYAHANPPFTPPAAEPQKPQEPSACNLVFSKTSVCAVLQWEKLPTDEEAGSFLLVWNTPPPAIVAVKLWMPSMGHGSSPVKVETLEPTRHRATGVFFVMRGEWDIHVQLKNGTQVIDEAIQKIVF